MILYYWWLWIHPSRFIIASILFCLITSGLHAQHPRQILSFHFRVACYSPILQCTFSHPPSNIYQSHAFYRLSIDRSNFDRLSKNIIRCRAFDCSAIHPCTFFHLSKCTPRTHGFYSIASYRHSNCHLSIYISPVHVFFLIYNYPRICCRLSMSRSHIHADSPHANVLSISPHCYANKLHNLMLYHFSTGRYKHRRQYE